jgi:hypothetical protein
MTGHGEDEVVATAVFGDAAKLIFQSVEDGFVGDAVGGCGIRF